MTEQPEIEKIKNRIWITYKSRIEAEKRYRMYDNVSHIVLCVFSFALICVTAFSEKMPTEAPLGSYSIALSVLIIVFSVVVFGFGFGKTAILHRECYLRLQRLHDSRSDAEQIESQYHDIISSYPNHSDVDFEHLIINRTFFKSLELVDPSGKKLSWNFLMLSKYFGSQTIFWLSPVLVLVGSIGSIFWLW